MKLALALALVAPAAAFQAPASQKASVVVKDSIGIKHGRIAMTAFIGMMVQELGITFPGSINLDGSVQFSDILKDGMGFAAINNIPKFGLFQIVAFGFIAETAAMPATQSRTPRPARATCELQNGRAAMMGVTGAMMHSQLDSCDHHFFYPITHN
ncbi:chlorophyll A-B binding protein [Aureococcus anophagefferens]|nr:chlorophyll A-B binding protein [Aureococcus anophagefferens]